VGFTFKTSPKVIEKLKQDAYKLNISASRLIEFALSEFCKSDKKQISLV